MHTGGESGMSDAESGNGGLFDEIERRALFAMDDDDADDGLDVINTLRGRPTDPAADLTLAGYIAKHGRVPAFEGCDGQPYTVDVATDETGDPDRPVAAFLVFIRWAQTGAGIMDHTESGDLVTGMTEDEVRKAIGELSLYEVRSELDAAIERKRKNLKD